MAKRIRRASYALLLVLLLLGNVFAATHGRPDALSEMGAWWGDDFVPFIITSQCAPSASGLSLASFSCSGYAKGAVGQTADIVYVTQTAAAVGPFNLGDGTYWVLLYRDTVTDLSGSGWGHHQPGTAYYWQQSATQPAALTGGIIFAQVTVSGGAITAITGLSSFQNQVAANLGVVMVPAAATGGQGTATSPWTGWDTAITWAARGTYIFPTGFYSYSVAPNWAQTGIRLRGFGYPVLLYTGTGKGVLFDGTVGVQCPTCGVDDVYMENFVLDMNNNAANTNDAFWLNKVYRSIFRNIRVRHHAGRAFGLYGPVADLFEMIRYSIHADTEPTVVATEGVLFDWDQLSSYASANTCLNCVFEGVNGHGIRFDHVQNTNVQGGTSESNNGCGVVFTVNANHNLLSGFLDIEQNAATLASCQTTFGAALAVDVKDSGFGNQYQNIQTSMIEFLPGADSAMIYGGYHTDIFVEPGTVSVGLNNIVIRHDYTDNSPTQTTLVNGATDISFNNTDNSINSTTTNFLTAGITLRKYITISGAATAGNNVNQVPVSVTANKIVVNAFVTTGAAGPAITIKTALADIRKTAVRVQNIVGQIRPPDFWDNAINPDLLGDAIFQGYGIFMPFQYPLSTLPTNTLATDATGQGSLQVIGPDQSAVSKRGMFWLFDRDIPSKYCAFGIDKTAAEGFMNCADTVAGLALPFDFAPSTPSAGHIASSIFNNIFTGLAPMGNVGVGFETYCTDCIPATNPCQGTGTGAKAIKTVAGNPGTWTCLGTSPTILSFQPGHLTAVVNTKGNFVQLQNNLTVVGIQGSAIEFTCTVNPVITIYNCTDVTCATAPVTVGSVTLTAAGTAIAGTVNSASILAAHYVAWAISAGTCTILNFAVSLTGY